MNESMTNGNFPFILATHNLRPVSDARMKNMHAWRKRQLMVNANHSCDRQWGGEVNERNGNLLDCCMTWICNLDIDDSTTYGMY